jgi:hypothetical protein
VRQKFVRALRPYPTITIAGALCIITSLQAGERRICRSIHGTDGIILPPPPQTVQTGASSPTVSYIYIYIYIYISRAVSWEVNRQEHEADNSSASSTEVKNVWIYASSLT